MFNGPIYPDVILSLISLFLLFKLKLKIDQELDLVKINYGAETEPAQAGYHITIILHFI